MSRSPADNPVPGTVTFTAEGSRALESLAAALVDQCDGTPASIPDILEQVLSVDIEEFADALSETADQHPRVSFETGPPADSPDRAARRRLAPGHVTNHPGRPPRVGR
jgi:hypothetical protein